MWFKLWKKYDDRYNFSSNTNQLECGSREPFFRVRDTSYWVSSSPRFVGYAPCVGAMAAAAEHPHKKQRLAEIGQAAIPEWISHRLSRFATNPEDITATQKML